jgi:hypothetical protein
MRQKSLICIFFLAFVSQGCFPVIQKTQKASRPSSQYQQVDFQSLVKRYLKKEKFDAIEGIYSVSGTVMKKGKGFLGTSEKEKVTDRKENYAQVAIVRDLEEGQREYLELSLDAEMKSSYSVVGEFSLATNGNILIYKHLAGKNSTNYTFTTNDKGAEILEGIRTENDGNTIITYKLTYVKLFPK